MLSLLLLRGSVIVMKIIVIILIIIYMYIFLYCHNVIPSEALTEFIDAKLKHCQNYAVSV